MTTKSSDLSGREVVELFNGISFAMWYYGPKALMNYHVTIAWRTYGVEDQRQASRLLGLYLNRCAKWAERGLPTTRPGRVRRHPLTGWWELPFLYVYTCEHAADSGFHSHILCTVPGLWTGEFDRWSAAVVDATNSSSW